MNLRFVDQNIKKWLPSAQLYKTSMFTNSLIDRDFQGRTVIFYMEIVGMIEISVLLITVTNYFSTLHMYSYMKLLIHDFVDMIHSLTLRCKMFLDM